MSKDYAIERATAANRWGFAGLLAIVAALVSAPSWAEATHMRLVVEFAYYLALAQMWNLLAGYAGLVSVGQQAYVGLGSYAFISAAVFFHMSPYLALPLAGVAAALFSIPAAFLLFRLQGPHFAIGAWALAEVLRLFFTQVATFGAGTGMTLPISVVRAIAADRATRDLIVYYVGLGIGLGSILFVYLWLRSRSGLALTAIRDSASAAASVGINQGRIKLLVYVVAAAFAGLVGGLIILQKLRITPAAGFSVLDWSANVIFIVVIGGIGSVEGPIVGALIFFLLRGFLADYGSWYLIILGLVAIVTMIKAPAGVWGFIVNRTDFHLFPTRHRIRYLDSDSGAPRKPDAVHASPSV